VIAELQRKFMVSAAETGDQNLHRRASIGIAFVSADRGHIVDVLDAAERLVASARRWSCFRPARTAAQQRRLDTRQPS